MGEFIQIYDEKKRKREIKKEKNRLMMILGEQDDLATKLIETAAFLKVEIDEAEALIRRDGIVEPYKNGENQYGQKKSSAVEVHDKFLKNYQATIRQLAEIRSSGDLDQQDAFIAHITGN